MEENGQEIHFNNKKLKQNIAKLYIGICKELFGMGVQRIKIEIHPAFILIRANHGRSSIMKSLKTGGYDLLVRDAEFSLGKIFKARMLEVCNSELDLEIDKVFRDYEKMEVMTVLKLKKNSRWDAKDLL